MKGSFIALYKNVGESSFKALSRVKKHFNTKKVGHLGTLDLLAEGVLGVCVGEATKLIPYVESEPKVYEVEIFFGYETESFDAEGIDKDKILDLAEAVDFSRESLVNELEKLKQVKLQVPPIFSAIKINGVRAYELARKGALEQCQIKAKSVELYSFEVLDFSLPLVKLRLETSSGYYVRSLVRDLGLALKVKAFMYSLKRTEVGNFTEKVCSDFSETGEGQVKFIDYEKVLKKFVRIDVNESDFKKLQNGLALELTDDYVKLNTNLIYVFFENSLVSLVRIDLEKKLLVPIKNFKV
jgi:tRNA pseudouridine55 synthase